MQITDCNPIYSNTLQEYQHISIYNIYHNSCCVYWIHHISHQNIFEEGYIGISNNPKRRFQEHKLPQEQNTHLKQALKKYPSEEIEWSIILVSDKEYCLDVEEKLRFKEQIGWNITKGGGIPPSRKGKSTGKPAWNKGKPSPFKGISGSKRSEETKLKIKEARKKQSAPNKGKKLGPQSKESIKKKSKTWLITSASNEGFIIINLNKFCRENKLNSSNIKQKYGSKGWKAIKID